MKNISKTYSQTTRPSMLRFQHTKLDWWSDSLYVWAVTTRSYIWESLYRV